MSALRLAKKFHTPNYYKNNTDNYSLLPFRFLRTSDKIFVSNEVGEYLLLEHNQFNDFVSHSLDKGTDIYLDLKAKHFFYDNNSTSSIDLLALKLRTKHHQIKQFTSLHIFVVTLRCDYSCQYCQVSRQSEDKEQYDMSKEVALKSIDFVFKSPSKYIKIEYQGGETLLNFELIKFITEECNNRNLIEKRDIKYVIATNLSFINDEILEYCYKNDIYISTSLDGPKRLHDKNRPKASKNGYDTTIKGIQAVRNYLGPDKISALMTTTEESLGQVKDIVDEYLLHNFNSIFLRPLSPYGFAIKTKQAYKYDVTRWLKFYEEGLEYIINLNKNGTPIREVYASIILTKLLTPHNPGYVDLQSPTGLGINVIVFNYDGYVYASDEARMLAEMNEYKFRLGNILENTYEEILTSDILLDCIEDTLTESSPMCTDCAYQPYCGSDPVYHYATQRDIVGNKPKSGFCAKNMGVIELLINKMESDHDTKKIFLEWTYT